jgi:hypothetical protein
MDYSYLGSGKISLREVGAAAGLLEVGNCSALAFSVTEDVKELKDYTQPGGGTYNEVRRISAVELSMTAHDLSPENLARALYGSVDAVAGVAVVNELFTAAYKGGALIFSKVPTSAARTVESTAGLVAGTRANTTAVTLGQYLVPAAPNGYYYKVTIAGTTAAAPPTFPTVAGTTVADGTATLTCMGKILLVANADYENTAGGIRVLSTTTNWTDGEGLTIDYTAAAANVVQALTNSAKEYEIVFEGLNEARSGKSVIVSVYRGKLGAAQSIGLIGDDFAALEVTGKLLKDTSKSGAGVSQYFKVALVT